MKTVYCPLIKGRINGTDCGTICDVADGMFKKEVLPENIIWNNEQRRKCLNCIYHYPIEHCILNTGRKVIVIKNNEGMFFASEDVDPEYWNFFEIKESDIERRLD